MKTSILNFSIVNSPKTKFSDAQVLLQEFAQRQFSRNEAEIIWADILNHKWNLSKDLGLDVGFRVATIDFIENFHPGNNDAKRVKKSATSGNRIPLFLRNVIRFNFESKDTSLYL